MSELLDNVKKRKELLKHMILQLHEGKAPEAGIQDLFSDDVSGMTFSKDKPSWFLGSKIVTNLDIRPLLESGEQPIQHVLRECRKLKPDEICEVISPFLPAPLIEQAVKQGYSVWSKEERPDVYKTYFYCVPDI